MLFHLLAARGLGPSGYGAFTVAMSFVAPDFVRAWRILWVGGIVFALNGWLWAVSLVPVVFVSAYAPAQAPLHVLLMAVPLEYVNYLLTQSLLAAGHERLYAIGAAACAALNVGVNLLAIPRWGAAGAAWATVMTESALLLVCLLGLRDVWRIIPLSATLVTGAIFAGTVTLGWWALCERPFARGALALVVSVVCWEAAAPWPLRKLLARPITLAS